MSWQLAVTFAALAFAVVSGSYGYAEAVRRSAFKAIETGKRDLVDFKLHVEREFAGNGYIRDVETRLVNRLDRIENKIDVWGGKH